MYADVIRAMNLDKSCIKLDSSKIIGVLLIKNIINIENFNKVYVNKENNYRDYLCIDIVDNEVVYKITNGVPEDYNTFEITDDNNIKVTVKTLYNTIEKLKYAMVEDIISGNKKRYEEYLKNTTYSLDIIKYLHKTILAENWVNDFLNNPNDFIKNENEAFKYDLTEVQHFIPYIHKEYFKIKLTILENMIIENNENNDVVGMVVDVCNAYVDLLRILPEERFVAYSHTFTNNTNNKATIHRYYVNHEEIFISMFNRVCMHQESKNAILILIPILNKMKEHKLCKELSEFDKLCEYFTKFLLGIAKDFDVLQIEYNKASILDINYDDFLSDVTHDLLLLVSNKANNKVNKYDRNYDYFLGEMYIKIERVYNLLYKTESINIDHIDIIIKDRTPLYELVELVGLKLNIKENF